MINNGKVDVRNVGVKMQISGCGICPCAKKIVKMDVTYLVISGSRIK